MPELGSTKPVKVGAGRGLSFRFARLRTEASKAVIA
jgi:hypothetical protein